MKKILLFLMLLVSTVATAQTKEQTIGFIAKCMKEAEGLKLYHVSTEHKRSVDAVITQNIFTPEKFL